MKRETLIALGIAEDVIDKIMAENGKDIEKAKSDVTAKDNELLKANETIKGLQDAVSKFDGVDVEKLKTDLATSQSKYDADIAKVKLDSAIDLALINNKAKNTTAVKALLDSSIIKLDGDKVLGLDEQLTNLRTSADYLFNSDVAAQAQEPAPNNTGVRLNSGLPHTPSNAPDYSKMSDDEYYASIVKK